MYRCAMRWSALWLIALATPAWSAADGSPSALQVIDRSVGSGPVARDGMQVELNYRGWLYDASAPDHHGRMVDSSYERGQPIRFTLGQGQVIAGWDRGIRGMHVGGRRTLLIPARLAYGSRRVGDAVPPHAALVFDIELLGAH